jgi:rhamnose transport system permease protein
LLGLCAVLFGMLWKDAGLPPWLAALGAIGAGAVGGSVNALLITRLGLPPLIVTLGTFSLFRGLAEALTGGTKAYTNFPIRFSRSATDSFSASRSRPGSFVVVCDRHLACWSIGRLWAFVSRHRLCAEGARYAGIPVERRLALAYTLAVPLPVSPR